MTIGWEWSEGKHGREIKKYLNIDFATGLQEPLVSSAGKLWVVVCRSADSIE